MYIHDILLIILKVFFIYLFLFLLTLIVSMKRDVSVSLNTRYKGTKVEFFVKGKHSGHSVTNVSPAWVLLVTRVFQWRGSNTQLSLKESSLGSSMLAAELIFVLFQSHCSLNRNVPHLVLQPPQNLW